MHHALRIPLLGLVMRTQIQVVQKRISLMSHIHKSGVETRQYFPHSAEKNIPDRVPLVALITVQLCELTILQQGDLYLS